MSQIKSKQPIADRDPKIDRWQERSPVERRTDGDKRNPNRNIFFLKAAKKEGPEKSADTLKSAGTDGCG